VDHALAAKSLSFNYMFRGLPKEAVERVAEFTEVHEYKGGELLVRQFDSSGDLFIIVDGNAISRTFSGEVVARFGPGSIVGEVAFLDRQKRSANVASVGDSKAILIKADELWKIMEEDSAIGYTILKNLSQVLCMRLRSMNEFADSASNPMRS
jgi:CRP-like cAMP-binding protein